MGIIRRQSIQTSLLSYLGIGLGYVNVVLLFPKFFEPEEFGLTRIIVAIIGIASQLALFGLTNGIIRFFPRFSEGDNETFHGMLGLALRIGLVGVVVVSLLLLFFSPLIEAQYAERTTLLGQFYFLLFPMLLFEAVFQILSSFTRALYRSVANVFFKEVLLRAFTAFLLVLYHFKLLDFSSFMMLFVGQYGFIALGMVGYLRYLDRLNLKLDKGFLTISLRREMVNYGAFTLLSNFSGYFLLSIDLLMVGSMVGLAGAAFYAVAFYIAALLNIPQLAINNISLPVISEAWKRDDRKKIQDVYSKTSINQLVVGTLLFAGLWTNESSVFSILPDQYSSGKWVLFFIAAGRLIDVSFGANAGIILTSAWYRYDTYSNIVLIAVAIVLNWILIPVHGIVGAAMATAITFLLLNVGRYVLLRVVFGFAPFSWKSPITLLLGFGAYLLSSLVPSFDSILMDIAVRSAVVLSVFVPISIALKLSEEGNELLREIWNRFRRNQADGQG